MPRTVPVWSVWDVPLVGKQISLSWVHMCGYYYPRKWSSQCRTEKTKYIDNWKMSPLHANIQTFNKPEGKSRIYLSCPAWWSHGCRRGRWWSQGRHPARAGTCPRRAAKAGWPPSSSSTRWTGSSLRRPTERLSFPRRPSGKLRSVNRTWHPGPEGYLTKKRMFSLNFSRSDNVLVLIPVLTISQKTTFPASDNLRGFVQGQLNRNFRIAFMNVLSHIYIILWSNKWHTHPRSLSICDGERGLLAHHGRDGRGGVGHADPVGEAPRRDRQGRENLRHSHWCDFLFGCEVKMRVIWYLKESVLKPEAIFLPLTDTLLAWQGLWRFRLFWNANWRFWDIQWGFWDQCIVQR